MPGARERLEAVFTFFSSAANILVYLLRKEDQMLKESISFNDSYAFNGRSIDLAAHEPQRSVSPSAIDSALAFLVCRLGIGLEKWAH